ncbi:MAG: sulfatase-like hydrolase/transferase [Pirellulales bacterium]
MFDAGIVRHVRVVVALVAGTALPLLLGAAAKAADRPNIVVFYMDDLAYGDVGCYGGKLTPTPNIDSLAKNGARFTDGYVAACVCGPSRVGLMTGRYQARTGHDSNGGQPGANCGFRRRRWPIASRRRATSAASSASGISVRRRPNFFRRPAGLISPSAASATSAKGERKPASSKETSSSPRSKGLRSRRRFMPRGLSIY